MTESANNDTIGDDGLTPSEEPQRRALDATLDRIVSNIMAFYDRLETRRQRIIDDMIAELDEKIAQEEVALKKAAKRRQSRPV